jgi:nicotinate-nucleotide pyrophosphorylase (carboxylating)
MLDKNIITQNVKTSLAEDIGAGDVTAALIPSDSKATAKITTREKAIICGQPWVNEVFHQVDPNIYIDWQVEEGAPVKPNQVIVNIAGLARALLTAERCALNWLQTLSGTATTAAKFVAALVASKTQILDTRKTIPGLRYAQKYAVKMGGGINHRMGLYDAYLIKENHIVSCGSIANAVMHAREQHPELKVEVEVENLTELQHALNADADIIMLDNFALDLMREAVAMVNGQVKLEASGNVDLNTIKAIADTGVDFISVGAITKHLQAVDLSMRLSI